MKKLILLFVVLLPFLTGCKKDDKAPVEADYRQIAWNALSADAQKTVITDLKDAVVNNTDSYNNKTAVSVRFNTNMDALLGPIVIYIDPASKQILGQAPRF